MIASVMAEETSLHEGVTSVLCRRWLLAWGFLLLGYAVFGKGFAYFGYPPLFIGDAVLLAGISLALVVVTCWWQVFRLPVAGILLMFCGWGAIRTVPFLSSYGADALRDAAIWGYAAYAIVLCALIMSFPGALRQLLRWYEIAFPWLLTGTVVLTLMYRVLFLDRPTWPHAPDVPILQQKEGDVLVHMAGLVAFWMSGLTPRVRWIWVILLTAVVGVMAALDRAGTISFLAVLLVCGSLRSASAIPWRIAAVAAVLLGLLWFSNLRIEVPGGKGREFSFEQFATNVTSVFGDTGRDGMDSTKEWRLQWWKEIGSYTLGGRYFWQGKGFGVNLADDDGFQVLSNGALRSPHNIHMTVLARMGVPGLVLWTALLALWAWSICHGFLEARRAGDERWQGLFLFLGCLALAMVINASFDVFLEGPMGGIWFWSVFGVGMAATSLYREYPEVLDS